MSVTTTVIIVIIVIVILIAASVGLIVYLFKQGKKSTTVTRAVNPTVTNDVLTITPTTMTTTTTTTSPTNSSTAASASNTTGSNNIAGVVNVGQVPAGQPCTQDLDCQSGLVCSNAGVCALSRKIARGIQGQEQQSMNLLPMINADGRLGVKVEVSKIKKAVTKSQYGSIDSSASSSELFNVTKEREKKFIGNQVKSKDWFKKNRR